MTIRFRLVEDERRYLALRAEMYMRLSQSGATAAVLADVLRNLGKIESFAYAEGIRQGAVAVELTRGTNPEHSALSRHRDAYGSADTPLREIEKKKCDETIGIFEGEPLEFAPLTLTDAEKFYGKPVAAPAPPVAAPAPPVAKPAVRLENLAPPDDHSPFPEDADRRNDDDDLLFDAIESHRPAGDKQADEHLYKVSSPDFLDRVREELSAAEKSGIEFPKWEDLIFHLHRTLGIDAGALDLQLSTHEGRAVLDQAGFFDFPPPMFDMARFIEIVVPPT